MLDGLKRWGEAAGAAAACWAVLAFLVSATGGHLPPWATYAWAQSQDQLTRQNALAISQLAVIQLSDKVAEIQVALAAHPEDVNLQKSLLYWQQQLTMAQQATLQPKGK